MHCIVVETVTWSSDSLQKRCNKEFVQVQARRPASPVLSRQSRHRSLIGLSPKSSKAELAAALVAVIAVAAEYRPRGWCNHNIVEVGSAYFIIWLNTNAKMHHDSFVCSARDLMKTFVQAQPSSIHNLGVFAKDAISKGTILGAYPGFKRSKQEMEQKVRKWPAAKGYVYASDQGWYLDPTDSRGRAIVKKLWGTSDTTLAFINEPLRGQDTNVSIADGSDSLDILFVANKDIDKAEELLVDYGILYDRSSYGGAE